MKYSKESTELTAVVPDIGDGNPFAMEEVVQLLIQAGFSVDAYYLRVSQLPAKLFHVLMTMNSQGAVLYTAKGESVRDSIFARVLGVGMWNEFKFQAGLTPKKGAEKKRVGIVVQEMIIGATPLSELEKLFDHIFLIIPDVLPKQNAVNIMIRFQGMVTPVVWNRSAYIKLQSLELSPLLVKPEMLQSFAPNIHQFAQKNERVVAKTSGSGMPAGQIWQTISDLKEIGRPFEFHHPNFILTDRMIFPTALDAKWRRWLFMQRLAKNPPAGFISLPSEQARVALEMMIHGWKGIYGLFPPRGPHERVNLKEIQTWGIKPVSDGGFQKHSQLEENLGQDSFAHIILDHLNHL